MTSNATVSRCSISGRPVYQGVLGDLVVILSPMNPEIGIAKKPLCRWNPRIGGSRRQWHRIYRSRHHVSTPTALRSSEGRSVSLEFSLTYRKFALPSFANTAALPPPASRSLPLCLFPQVRCQAIGKCDGRRFGCAMGSGVRITLVAGHRSNVDDPSIGAYRQLPPLIQWGCATKLFIISAQ